jgi:AraC-like DNA-binding protein
MLIKLLFISTGLIGFVTAFLIFTSYKSNRTMNFYMVLLISVISLRYLLYGLTYYIYDISFRNYFLKYANSSIVVLPLCYLYFKKMVLSTKEYNPKELLHFIFPIFFFLFTLKFHNYKLFSIRLQYAFFFLFFVFVINYIMLIYFVLKDNIWIKKHQLKMIKKQKISNSWIVFLVVCLLLLALRLLVCASLELYSHQTVTGFSYQWIGAVIWLLILFKILISPEILYGYKILHSKINENRNHNLELNQFWNKSPNTILKNSQHLVLKEKIDDNILTYIEDIEKLSLKSDAFRDSKMTLTDLANKLNIPKSHISYLFKYHCSISFSEYKKVIRVHNAIKHIEMNYLKSNTLDSLSKKVGFTSYNPFFTSFKEISGVSPLEYYKLAKEEIDGLEMMSPV